MKKPPPSGPIHIRKGMMGHTMYCGLTHNKALWVGTGKMDEATCPQCVRAWNDIRNKQHQKSKANKNK